ncbi:MAG: aminotransferase class I/II-fold pyridoxal phosphate-dependent enzyme, partial [Clostridia bacterium]|nr:aminotransferase class I/II-fold pyridoxal phosphate-dependent enzyme [Clostridia bacterium]
TVFLANPNAPTGLFLDLSQIEKIVKSNPDRVVVIDEAYVDFGGESAISLIRKYDNLLVTGTFSKSRSLAGGRLGFGIASKELIRDLNTIKYSTNPYNVNRMTMAAGVGTLQDEEYVKKNCLEIIRNREWVSEKLKKLGFTMTDSKANFVFAAHPRVDGKEIYLKLKEKGVLVRHFNTPRLSKYNRITVGSRMEMEVLIEKLEEVLEEVK